MTVYINARFLTQPVSGVQRYARELLGALDRRLEADPALRKELGNVVALRPPGAVDDPGWTRITLRVLTGGTGHGWEQGALWRATRGGVLISLGNSGPLLHSAHVLALHDANIYEIPGTYTRGYRMWHKALRPCLARRAAALVTVSQFSARALARHLRIPEARFSIIANSAEHILRGAADPLALDDWALKPGGYWLSVGNQSPNKNIARLVAAHGALGDGAPKLVIAGGAAPGLAGDAGRTGAQYLGRVSDAELRALYAGAGAFIFPSLHEGFGIPPLEAMSLGVPVLAARGAAMPEVLGDAAMWFDPYSVADMAGVLRAFADLSAGARRRMIAAGQAQAAGFTWQASADRLVTVLREVRTTGTVGAHALAAPTRAVDLADRPTGEEPV